MSEAGRGDAMSRRRFIIGEGGRLLIIVSGLGLVACSGANQQRAAHLSATATAAAGQPSTAESAAGLGKFSHETIRALVQGVGIVGVKFANSDDKGAGLASGWLARHGNDTVVVTSGHVFADPNRRYGPGNVTGWSFYQPAVPSGIIQDFPQPAYGPARVPPAYVQSIARGRSDESHDIAAFPVNGAYTSGTVLAYDPNYTFQPNEQLLVLGYPIEMLGFYGDPHMLDPHNINPNRTTMRVSLATFRGMGQGTEQGLALVDNEEDGGASGGAVIAERGGQYYVVGALTGTDSNIENRAYVTPLADLDALLA